MSARKRRAAPTDAQAVTDVGGGGDLDPTTVSYTEATSLLFDPNRVLLRRVFFLDPDKTRYISVGYYPSRNYQPLVEIGTPKQHPILTDRHVSTLADHLPAQGGCTVARRLLHRAGRGFLNAFCNPLQDGHIDS